MHSVNLPTRGRVVFLLLGRVLESKIYALANYQFFSFPKDGQKMLISITSCCRQRFSPRYYSSEGPFTDATVLPDLTLDLTPFPT